MDFSAEEFHQCGPETRGYGHAHGECPHHGRHWSNFKGAVKAKKRHDTYMNVWSAMYAVHDR